MITLEELVRDRVFDEIIHMLPYPMNIFHPDTFEIIMTNNLAPADIDIPKMSCHRMVENCSAACDLKCKRPLEVVKREKETLVCTYQYQSEQGNHAIEIHSFPLLDAQNKVVAIIQIYIDTTEQVKLENQLKSSVKRFKSLIENVDMAIMYYNLETKKIDFVNKPFREFFHYTEFDLHRLNPLMLHFEKDYHLIENSLMFTGQDGEHLKTLRNVMCKKNLEGFFYADVHSAVVELDEGSYLIRMFSDVTERKEAEEALERLTKNLEQEVFERTKELQIVQDGMQVVLISLAETRDNETGAHIIRTGELMRALAKSLSRNPKYKKYLNLGKIDMLAKTAPLHDIGKIGIPDAILLKTEKLSPNEFEIIKTHTQIGKKAMEKAEKYAVSNEFIKMAKIIAYTHHEKWDGTGYPQGLKGEEIPLSGRLMALVDIYDALTSKRVYKRAYSHEEAKKFIFSESGSHLDPEVVQAFLEVEQEFVAIKNRIKDEEDMY